MKSIRSQNIFCAGGVLFAMPVFATALLLARPTQAATINVNAGCTVSQAIASANGDTVVGSCSKGSGHDDIVLAAGTFNISTAIEVWSDVTFRGTGMSQTTIVSSNVNFPSFASGMGPCNSVPAAVYINAPDGSPTGVYNVKFQDLTLQASTSVENQGICNQTGVLLLLRARVTGFQNGGVYVQSDWFSRANLDMTSSLIDSNQSDSAGGGVFFRQYEYDYSSGDASAGVVQIRQSTISNNFSGGCGGGLYIGQEASLSIQPFHTIDSTTISGNSSSGNGGGYCQDIDHAATYVMLRNSTVSNNAAGGIGGGLWKLVNGEFADLQVLGSIVHGNTATSDSQQANVNYHPTQSSVSWRMQCDNSHIYTVGAAWTPARRPSDPNGTCSFTLASSGLGALVGKGGVNNLPVHPLLSGSANIDRLGGGGPATDERGYTMQVDGNGDNVKSADRGAYEYIPLQFETESMSVSGKTSGVTHSVISNSDWYSNDGGTNLQSTALNQYVVYQSPSVPSGTYQIVVRYKAGANAGKFQLSRANSHADAVSGTGTAVLLGSVVDSYAANDTWVDHSLGNFTFSSTAIRYFKFQVTGKNTSSSNYRLYPDFILLIKQ